MFRRTDLGRDIRPHTTASWTPCSATTIGEGSARIGTIEHLMAALAGAGVDNV